MAASSQDGSASPNNQDSLLRFPCVFAIKIIGRRSDEFAQSIVEIVKHHAPDYDASTIEMRPSSQGAYLSLTCTINAQSRDQLDGLYRALTAHPQVVMVL